jgi:hypothetical protein
MQRRTAFIVAAAVALCVTVVPVRAQQPSERQENNTAQGQLVRIDTTEKVIVIKTAPDAQMLFSYSEETEVTGSDELVAGLATLQGIDISVTYTKHGQQNVATKIEVRKKQAA